MKKIIYFCIMFLFLYISKANWELTNGPGASYVPSIYIDNNKIYAVSGLSIFLSTNEGQSWKLLNNQSFFYFSLITSIVKNKNTLFAGTKKGVYLSTNDGSNWDLVNSGFQKNDNYIIEMAESCDKIYALTFNKLYLFNEKEKKWVLPNDSAISNTYMDYSAIMVDSNKIYLGKKAIQEPQTHKANIFISSDYGKTWKSVLDTTSGIYRCDISSFALKEGYIYAGTNKGIFISSDGGESWALSNKGLLFKNINCIHISGDNIFVGTSGGLFLSTNNGQSWSLKVNAMTNINIQTIESYDNKIFAGTLHGLFITTNNGEIWKPLNKGLCGGVVWTLTKDDGRIYTGTYQEGMFITSNKGDSWEILSQEKKFSSIHRLEVNKQNIYAGLYMPGGFIYSNNSGKSWISANNINGLNNKNIECIVIDKSNVFVGTWKGLFLSKDNGNSWKSVSEELEDYRINCLAISDNYIFAGTSKNGLLKSTDFGKNWTLCSNSFTKVIISSIVVNGPYIYVGTYNTNQKTSKGIFLSTDMGETWVQKNNGLTDNYIKDIIIYNNNLFVCTEKAGIFLSINKGEIWKNINNGLFSRDIEKLLIFHDEIFAATTIGVFKAPLSDFGITNVEDNKIEKRNYLYSFPPYPMPAQDIVNALIYWDTGVDIDNDKIDIIDIFGNKIGDRKDITINKQTQFSGILTWNCSDVPNGIYFILINHGTEKRAVKVMVRK